MKILVTGASGSAGSYLCAWLRDWVRDAEVHGTARRNVPSAWKVEGVKYYGIDLTSSDVHALVRRVRPDLVFHLAADADVRRSFDAPAEIFHNNAGGTARLFDSLRLYAPGARVLLASTPEVYGTPTVERVAETLPVAPANPYAASKAAQEMIALAFWRSYGLQTVITRAFSYVNPRRVNLFTTAFARQLVGAEKGADDVVRHGYLDSVRALTDVRDICDAYWLALEKGVPGEAYNIGSGEIASVREVLEILRRKAHKPVRLEEDPSLLRPVDIARQVPDCRKFEALTGWKPQRTLDVSLSWLMEEIRRG